MKNCRAGKSFLVNENFNFSASSSSSFVEVEQKLRMLSMDFKGVKEVKGIDLSPSTRSFI